jgi:hypothetical protein
MFRGFTRHGLIPCCSSTSYTGIQYTPVDSIAALVMPQMTSQSAICCRSPVNVPHLRTGSESRPAVPPRRSLWLRCRCPLHSAQTSSHPAVPIGSVVCCAGLWQIPGLGGRALLAAVFLWTCRFLSLWQLAKPRKRRYSFNWNQFGMLLRTVATVWCTGLGTTLPIGFESTTVISAYFRCLSPSSVLPSAGLSHVPFPLVPPTRASRS